MEFQWKSKEFRIHSGIPTRNIKKQKEIFESFRESASFLMPERILMTISGLFGYNFRQTKRVKDMECGHCGMWTCVKVKENEKKM